MSQGVRTAAQAAKDVVVFKALANPVRLQIVSFVAASPEGQVSAGQIVERFSLSQPTISHHLRVLREAGVLTTLKASTFVYYRFAPQLRETVSAVLPDAAAAQPPAATTPVRKSAAPTKSAAKAAPAKAAAAKAAPRGRVAKKTAAPATSPDPQVQTPADEPVDAGPVMPIAESVEPAKAKGSKAKTSKPDQAAKADKAEKSDKADKGEKKKDKKKAKKSKKK